MVAARINLLRSIIKSAFLGLRQGAGVHSLSVGIIALSLTALGAFGLVLLNVSRLADSWNRELMVVAFLKPDASVASVEALQAKARGLPGVLDASYVSKDLARTRLKAALGDRAALLEGLEDRVIPAAVEVELQPGSATEMSSEIAAALQKEPAVAEVAWGAEELSRLGAVVGILRIAGGLLGALIALVTVLVISNTLKLTVLARREEIEILKLVGAGDVFVRAPFLIEGAVQGLTGAALAGGCLLALHSVVAMRVEETLSQAFGPMSLGGPPWPMVGLLMALGLGLGVLGGLVGVSRFLKV